MKIQKLISLFLAVCVIVGICAVPMISGAEEDCTSRLLEKGIVKGYGNGNIALGDKCTREQFMTFLYRLAGEPDAGKSVSFSDVVEGSYYADAVNWAYNNEITNGSGDGAFGVGKTVDGNLATYYLYRWALATGNGYMDETCYLANYEDGADVELYARTSYAWAVGSGVVLTEGNKLNPKAEVSREWVISALGRIMARHYHKWSEYKDNGDGTHSRMCLEGGTHGEKSEHTFNAGELTTPAASDKDGEITYTCTACRFSKKEPVKAGTEVLTRKDLEEAVKYTAWAYYAKGPKVQYDSTHFSALSGYYGGMCRLTARSAPEVSTSDKPFFSVCSDYTYQVYYEALGMNALGDITYPFGLDTTAIFRYADNQKETLNGEEKLNIPCNERDVDTAVIRWVDYDRYPVSKRNGLYPGNILESASFTDNLPGLVFKNDAPDGESHYSYYDTEGNLLTYEQVRKDYVVPFVNNYKNNLRVGDFIMYHAHAMLYMGGNTLLHCNGSKIDRSGPKDNIEYYPFDDFHTGAINVELDFLEDLVMANYSENLIIARPLEQVVTPGFDEDPGNDIVVGTSILPQTKSRINYPVMDIDRTVDITDFGTAVKGGDITYTVEIANNTHPVKYQEWYKREYAGKSGAQEYNNIKVTEKIPAGTVLKKGSVSKGGKEENGIITWNVDSLAPGETVKLSYTVTVTAEIGDVIINDGGMVDNIPSNIIRTTVGGDKLTKDRLSALGSIADGGKDNLAKFGSDTDFAEAIYKEIGAELDIPAVRDIADNLFTYSSHTPGDTVEVGGLYGASYTPINLFIRQNQVPENYKDVKSMIVDRYWGGSKFYVGDELKWQFADNAIKDFSTDYLEAGDILVYYDITEAADGTLNYESDRIIVMVYDGEKLLCSAKTEEGVTYSVSEGEDVDEQLLNAFKKAADGEECHLFFVIRPSQKK